MSTTGNGKRRLRRVTRTHVSNAIMAQPLHRLGLVGAFVVLALTAAFGGLQAEAKAPAAPLVAGHPLSADPFQVTVEKAVAVSSLPGLTLAHRGDRWLVVTASVQNTTSTTVFGAVELRDAILVSRVPGLLGELEPGTRLVASSSRNVIADGSVLDTVQPGLTYDVAFLWEQAEAAAPPTSLQVTVEKHSWTRSAVDGTYSWQDPEPAASALLPVEVKTP